MKQINQKAISAGEYFPDFEPGTPLLIEGAMILQCMSGRASFTLDFKHLDIHKGDIVFLFNDMIIELGNRSDDFSIRYVSIISERVLEIYLSITSQKFWDKLYLSPVQNLKGSYSETFDCWMKKCLFVYNCCTTQTADAILVNQVISLFNVMEDIINQTEENMVYMINTSPWGIIGDFLVLLSRHYMTRHKVSFYAEALNITPDYLSRLMKEYLGNTPKEAIETKLVLAMKALLDSTNLSVKDITDKLHYEDSSHLCKVFRRHTGMSPIRYRNRMQR